MTCLHRFCLHRHLFGNITHQQKHANDSVSLFYWKRPYVQYRPIVGYDCNFPFSRIETFCYRAVLSGSGTLLYQFITLLPYHIGYRLVHLQSTSAVCPQHFHFGREQNQGIADGIEKRMEVL